MGKKEKPISLPRLNPREAIEAMLKTPPPPKYGEKKGGNQNSYGKKRKPKK